MLSKFPARVGLRFVFAAAAMGVTVDSASAGWNEFWHNFKLSYHRANAWPDPFTEADARDVVEPFEIMKRNGWQSHNTITHELFREGDGVLMASGNHRLRWIVTQAPANRRNVYVVRGRTPEETQARLTSVRESLTALSTEGPTPEVYLTNKEPGYSSGAWATKVNREWLMNLPIPQLPTRTATGGDGITEESDSE